MDCLRWMCRYGNGDKELAFDSGNAIIQFPAGGHLTRRILSDESSSMLHNEQNSQEVPIIGSVQLPKQQHVDGTAGRLFIHGDSNCIDTSFQTQNCWPLLLSAVKFTGSGEADENVADGQMLTTAYTNTNGINGGGSEPKRMVDNELKLFSYTIAGQSPGWSCKQHPPLAKTITTTATTNAKAKATAALRGGAS